MDSALLQTEQVRAGWEACTDAYRGDLAKIGLGAVDDLEDDVQRVIGGADIAGTQPGTEVSGQSNLDACRNCSDRYTQRRKIPQPHL